MSAPNQSGGANLSSPRGRGATVNPPNRFEQISLERDVDWNPEDDPAPRTQFLRDLSQTIITYNDSPDISFDAGINVYRGCEHGCSYCYARNTHEYLGFSAGLDFETRIMVKENAPELLRRELSAPKWKPQILAMSGVTDCYQPIERRLQLTRRCLGVLAEFRNPVGIITKNHLVTRDLDFLRELAAHHAVAVNLSINSLDSELARKLEPRASSPKMRLAAIEALAKAGVPVGVLVAPVIPALNDHEIPSVLAAAKAAGAGWAGTTILRLPLTVAPIFEQWLEHNFPEKKEKVLGRIRAIRGGKVNDVRFGSRMRGEGIFADQISQMFHVARRKAGFSEDRPELSMAAFRRPGGSQLALGLSNTIRKIRSLRLPNIWPVVQRELREGARRPANRRLRLLSAGVGTLLLWAITSEWRMPTQRLGGYLLGCLHTFLTSLIFLIVPAMAADGIAREKREGTLGLLFMTPLSADGIVAGKALAQGLRAFTLWLAVLPILTIPFLTGGITWFGAFIALSKEFSAAVLCLAAGLLASSLAKERNAAFLLAFVLAILFMLFFSVVSELFIFYLSQRRAAVLNSGILSVFGDLIDTLVVLPSWNYRTLSLAKYLRFCLCGPLLTLALFFFVSRFAAWRITRSWQDKIPSVRRESLIRRYCAPLLRRRFQREMRRTLERNPIAWLQQYSWKSRLSKWGLCLLFVIVECAACGSARPEIFGLAQFALALALAGIYTFVGVSGFLEEKRNGALELLLVTPISVNKLIFGRVWGLWKQFTPAALILCIFVIADQWANVNPDEFFAVLQGTLVLACAFYTLPIFSTYFALRVKNLIVAAVLTWIVLLAARWFAESASELFLDAQLEIVIIFLSYGAFALLACFMLRHSLSRRIYSF